MLAFVRSVIFYSLLFLLIAVPAGAADKLPFKIPQSGRSLPAGAVIETSKGLFKIEFFRDEAPISVASFVHLVGRGFYSNLIFHRYEPGFVIQGGDPTGKGKGGPGYTLPAEFSGIPHEAGIMALARSPDQYNPGRRSNGSQFYICLSDLPHLDRTDNVFARVVSGLENVEKLRQGDKIVRIVINQQ